MRIEDVKAGMYVQADRSFPWTPCRGHVLRVGRIPGAEWFLECTGCESGDNGGVWHVPRGEIANTCILIPGQGDTHTTIPNGTGCRTFQIPDPGTVWLWTPPVGVDRPWDINHESGLKLAIFRKSPSPYPFHMRWMDDNADFDGRFGGKDAGDIASLAASCPRGGTWVPAGSTGNHNYWRLYLSPCAKFGTVYWDAIPVRRHTAMSSLPF